MRRTVPNSGRPVLRYLTGEQFRVSSWIRDSIDLGSDCRRNEVKALTFLALLLVACPVAEAMPIVGLYSTGINAAGGVDQSWSLTGGTAYVTQEGQFPVPTDWPANDLASRWISPQSSYVGGGGGLLSDPLNASFTYTLSFDLTGFNPESAWFSYKLAADDTISAVMLNGIPIAGVTLPSNGPFEFGPVYTVDAGFLAGVNSISVTVQNSNVGYGNPSGFRAEIIGSNVDPEPIPEPATYALVGLALVALPLLRRK